MYDDGKDIATRRSRPRGVSGRGHRTRIRFFPRSWPGGVVVVALALPIARVSGMTLDQRVKSCSPLVGYYRRISGFLAGRSTRCDALP